jgi:hypothetical protein
MNTTRTLTVPIAFVAGSAAALAVLPHPSIDRVVPDAAAFVDSAVSAVAGTASGLMSELAASPALVWVIVGFLAMLVLAARLAMGWDAHPDEHEGFDIR